jgi:hypothetical protein
MTIEDDGLDADDDVEHALRRALAAILGLPPSDDGLELDDPIGDDAR